MTENSAGHGRRSIFTYETYPTMNPMWNCVPGGYIQETTSPFQTEYSPNVWGCKAAPSIGAEHNVVHFPITNNTASPNAKPSNKRKTNSSWGARHSKQYASEEKMAEHMSCLRINSETSQPATDTPNRVLQRLYMCREMRKLQTESILPQTLLRQVPRPCTALMVWKPPPSSLLVGSTDSNDTKPLKRQDSNNNSDGQMSSNLWQSNLKKSEETMECDAL